MGSTRKRSIKENKYIAIDREMSRAFRAYDDLAVPPVRDFESVTVLPTESITILPTSNADVPAEYTLVPGKYTAFREEYLKEITASLEAANKRRERKMGGRK